MSHTPRVIIKDNGAIELHSFITTATKRSFCEYHGALLKTGLGWLTKIMCIKAQQRLLREKLSLGHLKEWIVYVKN